MAGKRSSKKEDPLSAVVILDKTLLITNPALSNQIIMQLSAEFRETGSVKSTAKITTVPNSIQWITVKTNASGKKTFNEWRQENYTILPISASFFSQCLATAFQGRPHLEDLLPLILDGNQVPDDSDVRVLVYRDEECDAKKTKSYLNTDLKRKEEEQLYSWTVQCHVLHGVSVSHEPKPVEEVIAEIVRATKSILKKHEAMKEEELFLSSGPKSDVWIPRKSGNPVSVTTSNGQHVGLMHLWQRHLMEITKVIGVEQSKSISQNENFSAPMRAFAAYEGMTPKEGEEFLSKSCIVRPPGSTREKLALRGARPNIGPETSRKVYKYLTSLDGNEKL